MQIPKGISVVCAWAITMVLLAYKSTQAEYLLPREGSIPPFILLNILTP